MTGTGKIFCASIFAALLIVYGALNISAYSSEERWKADPDTVNNQSVESGYSYDNAMPALADIIPEDASELLPDEVNSSLESGDAASAATALDGGFVLDTIGKILKSLLPGAFRQAAGIIGIIVCAAVFRTVNSEKSASDSVSTIIDFVSCLCILLYAYDAVSGIWDKVSVMLSSVNVFMQALLPTMALLYTSAGCVTSSAVSSAGMSLLISLFESVSSSLLYPVLRVSLGLAVVSSFTDSVDLSGIVSFVKKTFITVLTFIMALLSAVMAYQHVLAQSADSVLTRTVRFAAGSFIPVVGNSLSEATGNILSSISLIRSTAGTISAVSVILLVLPPVISIILGKIGFGLASVVSKTLGCMKEAKLLDDINGILDFALALVASCAVMFIFALAMFAKTSVGN